MDPLKIFWPSRKNLHFFLLHFSSSFSNSLKIFKALDSSTQNYLFNEVLLLIISVFLQEQLTKMCGLPIFLKYTLVTGVRKRNDKPSKTGINNDNYASCPPSLISQNESSEMSFHFQYRLHRI